MTAHRGALAFMAAWKHAGFRPVGHLVFRKSYASGQAFLRYAHESAYVLAKGRSALPRDTDQRRSALAVFREP
ncbi:MAG TPA: hypothetical protein VHW09_13755 [Bryobacteraceae bacterium]|jgi:hypothetical protein|nr:hypothetical protein [Bryobacteraceae bacterium]